MTLAHRNPHRALVTAFVLVLAAVVAPRAQTAADNQADTDRLVAALGIRAGSTVCEVGAGGGAMTVLMATVTGASGRVYSNELNPARRDEITKAAQAAGLSNVVVLEGKPSDANLGTGVCDAVFMRNVYHHFAEPSPMNRSLFAALKDGARIGVIDFSPDGTESPTPAGRGDDKHHGVSSASVERELGEAGFTGITSQPVQKGVFLVVATRAGR